MWRKLYYIFFTIGTLALWDMVITENNLFYYVCAMVPTAIIIHESIQALTQPRGTYDKRSK